MAVERVRTPLSDTVAVRQGGHGGTGRSVSVGPLEAVCLFHTRTARRWPT